MKKILSSILVLGAIICLAGCGNKPSTLTCTKSSGSNKMAISANFMGNSLKSMAVSYDLDYSKYSDSLVSTLEKQDFCKKLSTAFYQYTLINCTQKVENKHMIVNAGVDMNGFTKQQKTGSPELTKQQIEKSGFTCELK